MPSKMFFIQFTHKRIINELNIIQRWLPDTVLYNQNLLKDMNSEYSKHGNYQRLQFPDESQAHEATWLQWPHQHNYGKQYEQQLQKIWVEMASALSTSQIVRIIVYNENHRQHVAGLLQGTPNIEFFIFQTDDVWVRDNGPIFAKDKNTGQLVIQHWGFNGWGNKMKHQKCNKIPQKIANLLGFNRIDLRQEMVNQGGSVETDGNGVMILCESSTINKNRNPGMSRNDAQALFKKYYGVDKLIWLKGKAGRDITDGHIDGFVKFVNKTIMLTFSQQDLNYWGLQGSDVETIYSSTNVNNQPYQIIKVPLTKNQLKLISSNQYVKGSYLNFYIANKVILVPIYGDQNDQAALQLIQSLYNDRKVVGVNVVNLYKYGGMIHCVTQQQPARNVEYDYGQ